MALTTTEMSPTSLAGPVGLLRAPGPEEADMPHCIARDPETTTTHPAWCDQSRCETTATDVAHTSGPVAWATRDARISLALVRADEAEFPDEWDRPPELAVEVESTVLAASGVRMYLDCAELQALIDALIGMHNRAVAQDAIVNGCLSCGAPVWGDIFCASCRKRVGR